MKEIDNKKMWEFMAKTFGLNTEFGMAINDALKDQGFQYKDGKIVNTDPCNECDCNVRDCMTMECSHKHKFSEGDWVIYNGTLSDHEDHIMQIGSIKDGRYEFTDGSTLVASDSDMYIRPWTINEAIDGDILYVDYHDDKYVILFKSIVDKTHISVHCYYWIDNDLFNLSCKDFHDIDDGGIIRPATQKERTILSKKIKEKGYSWMQSTKELVSIKPLVEDDKDKKDGAALVKLGGGQYSFMIPSNLFMELSVDQQRLWKDEIEQAYLNGLNEEKQKHEEDLERAYKNQDDVVYQKGYDKGYEDARREIGEALCKSLNEL